MRVLGLLATTLILVASCERQLPINGEYLVSFAWLNGTLQSVNVDQINTREKVPQPVQKQIAGIAAPFIEDQVRKANLERASGMLRLGVYGTPPYFRLASFESLNPIFRTFTRQFRCKI
jgi:hypothetical protein